MNRRERQQLDKLIFHASVKCAQHGHDMGDWTAVYREKAAHNVCHFCGAKVTVSLLHLDTRKSGTTGDAVKVLCRNAHPSIAKVKFSDVRPQKPVNRIESGHRVPERPRIF